MSTIEKVNQSNGVISDSAVGLPPKETKGKALHELYNKDTQEKSADNLAKKEQSSPSFFQKIISWLPFYQSSAPIDAKVADGTPDLKISATRPINHTPVLDKPEDFDEEETTISPFNYQANEDTVDKVGERKIAEGLALMSSLTMEQVAAIVLRAQLEIEKDRAITVQDSFSKLHDLRKIHQKTIEQVKDVLMKDEKVMGHFQTAQSVAKFASVVVAILAIGVTAAASGGFAVPALFSSISTIGTYATAGITALVHGGKAYSESQMNQRKATLTDSQHKDQRFDDQLSSHSDKMKDIAESDAHFSEHLMNLLKMKDRLSQSINKG